MAQEKIVSGNNTLAKIAVILSAIAIVLSVMALNQTAKMTPEELSRLIPQVKSLQQQSDVNRARQRLEDLRQKAAKQGKIESSEVQDLLSSVRNDLSDSFQSAQQNTQLAWQAIDKQLAEIQLGLKNGTISILDGLDRAINSLKRDIKYG